MDRPDPFAVSQERRSPVRRRDRAARRPIVDPSPYEFDDPFGGPRRYRPSPSDRARHRGGDGPPRSSDGSAFGVTGPMGVVPPRRSAAHDDARRPPDRFDPRDDPPSLATRSPATASTAARSRATSGRYAGDARRRGSAARSPAPRPRRGPTAAAVARQGARPGSRAPSRVLLVVGGFALVTRVIGGGGRGIGESVGRPGRPWTGPRTDGDPGARRRARVEPALRRRVHRSVRVAVGRGVHRRRLRGAARGPARAPRQSPATRPAVPGRGGDRGADARSARPRA